MHRMFTAAVVVALTVGACTATPPPTLPPPGARALEILFETVPPGAAVLVDGVVVGDGPVRVKLNPGPHRSRATLNAYTPAAEQKFVVGAGAPTSYVLTLVASH